MLLLLVVSNLLASQLIDVYMLLVTTYRRQSPDHYCAILNFTP